MHKETIRHFCTGRPLNGRCHGQFEQAGAGTHCSALAPDTCRGSRGSYDEWPWPDGRHTARGAHRRRRASRSGGGHPSVRSAARMAVPRRRPRGPRGASALARTPIHAGRGARPLHSLGRGARRRACHPGRYLRGRAQAPPTTADLERARDERLSSRARCHRSRAGECRHRVLHASACRSRRLEYDVAQWAMGPDVSQCPLSDRTDGARSLAAAARVGSIGQGQSRVVCGFRPAHHRSRTRRPGGWRATSCSMD